MSCILAKLMMNIYAPQEVLITIFPTSSESNAALVFRCGVGIILLNARINSIVVIHRFANNPIGTIKLFHEILCICDGGLIGTAEMVVKHDKSSKGVIRIDAICRSCPAFFAHFSEVVIIEIIKEVQMLNPSVEAVPDKQAEMIVVFRDVQRAFPLFVWVALLVESLTDTTLQSVIVFQWSAQKEI